MSRESTSYLNKNQNNIIKTEDILENNLPIDKLPDASVDEKDIRNEINKRIYDKWNSVNLFAMKCYVDRSLISQWFNMKKNMSRDRILCMLITLDYSLAEINELLKGMPNIDTLHYRIKRDRIIMEEIQKNKLVEDIDDTLRNAGVGGFENIRC